MTNFLIPLINIPQKFAIALGGREYSLTCKWNDSPDGGWVIDLDDATTSESIAANIPLITGADCLEGLEYLGINGKLIVFTDGAELEPPTLLNLGVESNLYYQTDLADG
jgi:hypothetical protein